MSKCEFCGAPDASAFFHEDANQTEMLCRTCAHRQAVYCSAFKQLDHRVRSTLGEWLSVWGDVAQPGDLIDFVNILVRDEAEKHFQPEGVQTADALNNAAD